MNDTPVLTSADRIAIVAPHPDDESIATGGLIQAALAFGATVRVFVLTDGDANIWPQRWIEKRWRIDAAGRARWGARRREEARAAMRVLGLGPDGAVFFGWPDLGLTELLMRGDTAVVDALRREFSNFAPNVIVLPSLADRHPDHSAANILVRLALDASAFPPPRLLEFAVHGGTAASGIAFPLNAGQQERKRAAILAHATQMRLSSNRFLRHADTAEVFHAATVDATVDRQLPLFAHANDSGQLHVELDARQTRRGLSLFVVMEGGKGSCRLLVPWHSGAGELRVLDATSRKAFGNARVQRTGKRVSLTHDCGCADWRSGFVKWARPTPGLWLFDQHGWQAIARSGTRVRKRLNGNAQFAAED
ncbi:MAG: PIG-L family deacetylase [Proteobacteria bacterium]|nr:PIG-L family deacetylase [Pseudomonadota bacterium]